MSGRSSLRAQSGHLVPCHPSGASGARLSRRLLRELDRGGLAGFSSVSLRSSTSPLLGPLFPFPPQTPPCLRDLHPLHPCDGLATAYRLHCIKSPRGATQCNKRLPECTLASYTNPFDACVSQELPYGKDSWTTIKILMRIGLGRLMWSIYCPTCWPFHLRTIRLRLNKLSSVVCATRSWPASSVQRTP